jgi:hypothetical protein
MTLKTTPPESKKEPPAHESIDVKKSFSDKKKGGKFYAGSTQAGKKSTRFFNIRCDLQHKFFLVGEISVITKFFQELNKDFPAVQIAPVIKHVELLNNACIRMLEGRPAANITQTVTRFFIPMRTYKINS